MSNAALDSSAVLTLLLAEPGADEVADVLPGAWVSAVGFAEVVASLGAHGMPAAAVRAAVESVGVDVVAFDADQACVCAEISRQTEGLGLTLGGRACLSLALGSAAPVITTDPGWRRIPGFDIRVVGAPDGPEPLTVDNRPSWLRGL